MSEVQSRPAASRGRGSGRGGRGGFASRGGGRAANRSHATNGDSKQDSESGKPIIEEEGEIGELRKKYGSKTTLIKEMFPNWSEVDILFALEETDGDETVTATRIAEGSISQWGEVSKQKKEKTRPKTKDTTFATTGADFAATGNTRPARGGRTGPDGTRGRGKTAERGARSGRGRSASNQTNGTRAKDGGQLSVPTEESSAWDTAQPAGESGAWGDSNSMDNSGPNNTAAEPIPSVAPASASGAGAVTSGLKTGGGAPAIAPKTWASMLRQSTAPKPAPKPAVPPAAKIAEPASEPPSAAEEAAIEPQAASFDEDETDTVEETPSAPGVAAETSHLVVPEVALPPPKDQLTETNLEQIADESHPPVTETTRSEAADSWDPSAAQGLSATATPLSAAQQQHQAGRLPGSGLVAKATDRIAPRMPSYTRKFLDQQEAVRMPGNRDQVDRAAVQFGAFSLNGPIDDDVDLDREEPETRAQPPDDSPVAQPRASLPPAPTTAAPITDSLSSQKAASSLTPSTGAAAPAALASQASSSSNAQQGRFPAHLSPQPISIDMLMSRSREAVAAAQPSTQSSQQFGRFGQTLPPEQGAFAQKPYDSFSQQNPATSTQSQFEGGYQSQQQAPQSQSSQQPQSQQAGGPFSSAPSDYSSYYTADPQSRAPYSYYNQPFNAQQSQQGPQDSFSQPGRSFSGYNAQQSDNLSQYPQSGSQHGPSRYGAAGSAADSQNSGNNATGSQGQQQQQQAGQGGQGQGNQSLSHGQQPHDYSYNHPYYSNPYYSAYLNFPGGYNQGGYGAPYGKGGVYGQPHQYGMSGGQGPYGGHGSSPATGFGHSSLHRGDSGTGGGLGDYGRAGSAQSGSQPGLGGGSGFGGGHDAFGRGPSSYQSGQGFSAQGSQAGSAPTGADDLKPFGDAKGASGPSPSLGGGAARPGSAANNASSQSGGLPPPQSAQQGGGFAASGYGTYPSHLQGHGLHGNQSGGAGYAMGGGAGAAGGASAGASAGAGAGGQQSGSTNSGTNTNNPYGSYGSQGFGGGGSYYGSQQQQQPRGWGGNYH